MKNKCPPGIICIENVTLFYISICLVLMFYLCYIYFFKQNISINNNINNSDPSNITHPYLNLSPNYPYSNLPPYNTANNDVYLNPYTPPLKDDRYLTFGNSYPLNRGIPINVSSNIGAVDAEYRQLGILSALNTKNTVLPLMGRPKFVNRDKWQFYTMNENNIKLNISQNGKSCTNEYGCDNLYNGDSVYVDGYDDTFKITMYENNTIKYIPYI